MRKCDFQGIIVNYICRPGAVNRRERVDMMSLYEKMTCTIDILVDVTIAHEKIFGARLPGMRGQIEGVTQARDMLTIESAESEAW